MPARSPAAVAAQRERQRRYRRAEVRLRELLRREHPQLYAVLWARALQDDERAEAPG